MSNNKKMTKKSIIGIVIGSVVGLASIIIAIIGRKKIKRTLKDHPTKYKPL